MQMLSATSFQITLLTGRNWQDNIQLYVLGGVFLAASAVWYPLFRLKPSVYVLSAPWIFFGLAFFLIGLPSVATALVPAHRALASAATWSYAIASAAAFLFFGLNFGEEAVRFQNVFITCRLLSCCIAGCRDRGLDSSGLRGSRITTNMGCCALVLGLHLEWTRRWLCSTLVDSPNPLALGDHELCVRLCHAVWSARFVHQTLDF